MGKVEDSTAKYQFCLGFFWGGTRFNSFSTKEKMLGVPLKSKSIYAIHVAAELGDATMVSWMNQQKSWAGV